MKYTSLLPGICQITWIKLHSFITKEGKCNIHTISNLQFLSSYFKHAISNMQLPTHKLK